MASALQAIAREVRWWQWLMIGGCVGVWIGVTVPLAVAVWG